MNYPLLTTCGNIRSLMIALSLALVVVTSSCTSVAQVSQTIEKVDGVPYYLHTVQKKETLYSLSKLYKCDINTITTSNPGTDAGIQEGQVIKIPVSASNVRGQSLREENGQTYLMHEVQKKETLYSIAKSFGVDVNELMSLNPGSDLGIKKGQVIRIPVKGSSKPVVADASMHKHLVIQGETLYSIAKKYSVTVEDIQNANGGLKDGLKSGVEINIPANIGPAVPGGEPMGTLPDKRFGKEILVEGPVYKEKYHIALMLPFYTNYKDTMDTRDKKLREAAVQMYRGAMLAADSLMKMGLDAEIHVYDVIDDKKEVQALLEKPEMKEMDLIIGPAVKTPFNEVSKWSADKGIHVVCPIQQPNNVLLNSPNMSKAVPSSATMWVNMARYIYNKHKDDNIVLIDSKNIDDRRLVDAFKEEWKKLSGDSLKNVVIVADAGSFVVKDKFSTTKNNIVVAPTSDKKVVNTLFKVMGDGKITVYGAESWDDLESINVANRNKYHVHFPQSIFLDYYNPKVQRWIESYRKKFRTEPGNYSLSGYDVMMFYGSGLKQFGRAFPNHFDEIKANTFGTGYDFFKTSDEGGFENQFVIVIGTDNYSLIREQ